MHVEMSDVLSGSCSLARCLSIDRGGGPGYLYTLPALGRGRVWTRLARPPQERDASVVKRRRLPRAERQTRHHSRSGSSGGAPISSMLISAKLRHKTASPATSDPIAFFSSELHHLAVTIAMPGTDLKKIGAQLLSVQMRHHQLTDSDRIRDREYLCGPVNSVGESVDPRLFTGGAPLDADKFRGLHVPLGRCGEPMEFTLADFDMPVVRTDLAQSVSLVAPGRGSDNPCQCRTRSRANFPS